LAIEHLRLTHSGLARLSLCSYVCELLLGRAQRFRRLCDLARLLGVGQVDRHRVFLIACRSA
jgi:hypothetical protein